MFGNVQYIPYICTYKRYIFNKSKENKMEELSQNISMTLKDNLDKPIKNYYHTFKLLDGAKDSKNFDGLVSADGDGKLQLHDFFIFRFQNTLPKAKIKILKIVVSNHLEFFALLPHSKSLIRFKLLPTGISDVKIAKLDTKKYLSYLKIYQEIWK